MSRGIQREFLATFEEILPEHRDLEEYIQEMVTRDLRSAVQRPSPNTSEDADLGFDQAHLDRATLLSLIEAQNLYVAPRPNPVRTPANEQDNRSGNLSWNNSWNSELDAAIALSLAEVEEADEDEPFHDSLIPYADDHEATNSEPSVAVTFQDDIDPNDTTFESQSPEEVVGLESRGLSKELLDSFPVQRLKAKSGWFSSNKTDPEGCPICVTEYEVGSKLLTLPCLHLYHKSCIKEWLKDHKTCPVCKIDVSAPQA